MHLNSFKIKLKLNILFIIGSIWKSYNFKDENCEFILNQNILMNNFETK